MKVLYFNSLSKTDISVSFGSTERRCAASVVHQPEMQQVFCGITTRNVHLAGLWNTRRFNHKLFVNKRN